MKLSIVSCVKRTNIHTFFTGMAFSSTQTPQSALNVHLLLVTDTQNYWIFTQVTCMGTFTATPASFTLNFLGPLHVEETEAPSWTLMNTMAELTFLLVSVIC